MPRKNWRRSTFYHMLEHGHDEMVIDLADCASLDFSLIDDLADQRSPAFPGLRAPLRRGRHDRPDGLPLFLLDDAPRSKALAKQELAALRDLVPVLGLAIKSAQQVDIARTLGRVYLGRDASEQVLRGRISRGVTERINAVLWFSDLRGSTAISESIGPDEIIPFLNDYAQAAIDAIHEAGGDVLKLIGDGVLAMFTGEDMAHGQARRAARRASVPPATSARSMPAAPPRAVRRRRPMSACMSARCFTAISAARTGSISPWSGRRSTRSAASPRCAARSIANCWRRRNSATGSMPPGRRYLVSTGRYALRGIGRAQDLYTLDPEIAANEPRDGELRAVSRELGRALARLLHALHGRRPPSPAAAPARPQARAGSPAPARRRSRPRDRGKLPRRRARRRWRRAPEPSGRAP